MVSLYLVEGLGFEVYIIGSQKGHHFSSFGGYGVLMQEGIMYG